MRKIQLPKDKRNSKNKDKDNTVINKEIHVRGVTVKRKRKSTNINKTVEAGRRKRGIEIEMMINTMIDMIVVEARKNTKKRKKKRIKNEDHVPMIETETTARITIDVCSKINIIFIQT